MSYDTKNKNENSLFFDLSFEREIGSFAIKSIVAYDEDFL